MYLVDLFKKALVNVQMAKAPVVSTGTELCNQCPHLMFGRVHHPERDVVWPLPPRPQLGSHSRWTCLSGHLVQ